MDHWQAQQVSLVTFVGTTVSNDSRELAAIFFRLRSHVRSDPSLSLRLMLFKHADLGEYVLVKGMRSIECVIADMVLDNDNGIVKSSLRIKADDVPQSVATCYVELSCTVGQLMDKMLLLLRTDGQWTP